MNNFFKKTLSFFGFADEDELNSRESPTKNQKEKIKEVQPQEGKIDNLRARNRENRKKVSFISSVKEQARSRVFIAEPFKFEEIQIIADNFKNNIPVLINLQKVDSEQSKRIIDFCSGLTYALEGNIRKVAEKVFLITPYNVEVTSKASDLISEEGLCNPF